MRRAIGGVALAVTLGSWLSTCHAWGTLVLMDAPPEQDSWSVGAQAMGMPRAPGRSQEAWTLLPAVDYYGHAGLFASTENGVGYNASPDRQWGAGVRVWPQFGRSRREADTLPHVGLRWQPQVFANWQANEALLLQSAVSSGNGVNRRGLQSEWGVTSGLPLGADLLGLGVSATWGNRAYRSSYIGIDRPGWADWSWTASVSHRFSPRWHVDAQWQWAHVIHAAESAGAFQSRQQGGLLALWRDL